MSDNYKSEAEQWFQDHLEGTWKRRWYNILPGMPDEILIDDYLTGEIYPDAIASVSGKSNDGVKVAFTGFKPGDKKISGYKKIG